MGTRRDILNQRFDKLLVIEDTGKKKANRRIWKCKCDCGNIVEIETQRLTTGKVTSCGCDKGVPVKQDTPSEHESRVSNIKKDLVGMRFGYLTVLADSGTRHTKGEINWTCRCDCGTILNVRGPYLTTGHTMSCGCLKSKGELKICKILTEAKIPYISQYHNDSCKFKDTGHYAYFDFMVDNKYIIEFDGIQHSDPNHQICATTPEEKEIAFKRNQEHDTFKNKWCKDNNIPLIRIPYEHYDKMCLEDLDIKTSKFII